MLFKELGQLSAYSKTVSVLVIVLLFLIAFATGTFVGYHRAIFGREWDDSYYGNVSRFDRVFMPFMHGDDINSHGAIGNITSVKLPAIMVQGPNQAEQVVVVSSSTMVRMMRSPASVGDLKSGQWVVVIGSADQNGEIQATLIRIIPPPPSASSTSPQPLPAINQ